MSDAEIAAAAVAAFEAEVLTAPVAPVAPVAAVTSAETVAASAVAASAVAASTVAPVAPVASAETVAPTEAAANGAAKKISLGSQVVFWQNPESKAAETDTERDIQTKILTYYGMESLDGEKKNEMLSALYHGACQTHQTILSTAINQLALVRTYPMSNFLSDLRVNGGDTVTRPAINADRKGRGVIHVWLLFH